MSAENQGLMAPPVPQGATLAYSRGWRATAGETNPYALDSEDGIVWRQGVIDRGGLVILRHSSQQQPCLYRR